MRDGYSASTSVWFMLEMNSKQKGDQLIKKVCVSAFGAVGSCSIGVLELGVCASFFLKGLCMWVKESWG